MTNPFKVRKSFGETLLESVIIILIAGFAGGTALMLLTSLLMPIGLSFWVSVGTVVLSRIIYQCISDKIDN